jgi:hypothetical protein
MADQSRIAVSMTTNATTADNLNSMMIDLPNRFVDLLQLAVTRCRGRR